MEHAAGVVAHPVDLAQRVLGLGSALHRKATVSQTTLQCKVRSRRRRACRGTTTRRPRRARRRPRRRGSTPPSRTPRRARRRSPCPGAKPISVAVTGHEYASVTMPRGATRAISSLRGGRLRRDEEARGDDEHGHRADRAGEQGGEEAEREEDGQHEVDPRPAGRATSARRRASPPATLPTDHVASRTPASSVLAVLLGERGQADLDGAEAEADGDRGEGERAHAARAQRAERAAPRGARGPGRQPRDGAWATNSSVPATVQTALRPSAATGEATATTSAASSGPEVKRTSSATESSANAAPVRSARPPRSDGHSARSAPPTDGIATPPRSPQATSAAVRRAALGERDERDGRGRVEQRGRHEHAALAEAVDQPALAAARRRRRRSRTRRRPGRRPRRSRAPPDRYRITASA